MTDRISDVTTPWTDIVLGQQGSPELRLKCLEELARKYHAPIRAYIGGVFRLGDPAMVDDLTQGFFLSFIEKDTLAILDQNKGSLHGFLKVAVRRYVETEMRRGGRRRADSPFTSHHSLHESLAQPDQGAPTPDILFERAWADTMLDDILTVFKAECQDRDVMHYYQVAERLYLYPQDYGNPGKDDVARDLGLTEKQVDNHFQRSKELLTKVTWKVVRNLTTTDEEAKRDLAQLRTLLTL